MATKKNGVTKEGTNKFMKNHNKKGKRLIAAYKRDDKSETGKEYG